MVDKDPRGGGVPDEEVQDVEAATVRGGRRDEGRNPEAKAEGSLGRAVRGYEPRLLGGMSWRGYVPELIGQHRGYGPGWMSLCDLYPFVLL